jgi:hypothetical protein
MTESKAHEGLPVPRQLTEDERELVLWLLEHGDPKSKHLSFTN